MKKNLMIVMVLAVVVLLVASVSAGLFGITGNAVNPIRRTFASGETYNIEFGGKNYQIIPEVNDESKASFLVNGMLREDIFVEESVDISGININVRRIKKSFWRGIYYVGIIISESEKPSSCGDGKCVSGETISNCEEDCSCHTTTFLADLDQDGRIDAVDIQIAANLASGKASIKQYPCGDVNNDGRYDAVDVQTLINCQFGGCDTWPSLKEVPEEPEEPEEPTGEVTYEGVLEMLGKCSVELGYEQPYDGSPIDCKNICQLKNKFPLMGIVHSRYSGDMDDDISLVTGVSLAGGGSGPQLRSAYCICCSAP